MSAKTSSIDKYFDLRNVLDDIKRQESAVREELAKAELDIISFLEENELEQVKSDRGSLSLSVKMFPSVKADQKHDFIKWAVEHDRLDVMIVRPNEKSVRDYYEETNTLPDGVETYMKSKLNMRRK